uniref:Adipose-secreted signaling protein n=1 Tax=Cairina moschata TaxID=8855 RepID=A0A8C3CQ84_CAIMO
MPASNSRGKAKAGGVRFAPSQPAEGAPGHVHFQEQLRDSAVMVTQEKDGHFLVKVGFLKILHKYEIAFLLPPSQRLGKDVCALPLPNPNLRVLSVTSGPEGKVPVSSASPRGPGGGSCPLGSGPCCCPHVPSTLCARVGGTSSAPLLLGDVPDATPVPVEQRAAGDGEFGAGAGRARGAKRWV